MQEEGGDGKLWKSTRSEARRDSIQVCRDGVVEKKEAGRTMSMTDMKLTEKTFEMVVSEKPEVA